MALTIKNSLGNVRSHVRPVAEEVDERWNLFWIWGIGATGDHAAGVALDFMVYTSDQRSIRTDVGNAIAAYMQANHKRLNVQYIIWRQRIWNVSRDREGLPWSSWRRMENRGNPTANHMDHVHVSFKRSGTYRPPSGPPSKPATRKVSLSALQRAARSDPGRKQGGQTSGSADDVRIVEDALRREGLLPKAYASDGSFGSYTVSAYGRWQRACGYSGRDADGIPGRKSLERLGRKYGFSVVN